MLASEFEILLFTVKNLLAGCSSIVLISKVMTVAVLSHLNSSQLKSFIIILRKISRKRKKRLSL